MQFHLEQANICRENQGITVHENGHPFMTFAASRTDIHDEANIGCGAECRNAADLAAIHNQSVADRIHHHNTDNTVADPHHNDDICVNDTQFSSLIFDFLKIPQVFPMGRPLRFSVSLSAIPNFCAKRCATSAS